MAIIFLLYYYQHILPLKFHHLKIFYLFHTKTPQKDNKAKEEKRELTEEQQKEVVEPVVQEAIVQPIPDYVISEEPVLQEMSDEPVYVPEVEMDEMPEDIKELYLKQLIKNK